MSLRRVAAGLVVLVACTSSAGDHPPFESDPPGPIGRANPPPVSPPPIPPPIPEGGPDDAGPLTITVYPRVGDATDDATVPGASGLILQGGGDVDEAFVWARERIAPGGSRRGDVVVITAGGGDSAQYFYDVADFASSQTVSIPPSPTKNDLATAGAIIAKAELVYFPGGEQNAYAVWKGTPVMTAVQAVYDKGGVIAGSSAGTLILGPFVFDAIAAGISENVTPAVALADPFDAKISFTRHMLDFPPLADAITEVHFEQIQRMGRLAMFMARQHTDNAIARTPKVVLGIGVDEQAAIAIGGDGAARFFRNNDDARAFLIKGGPPSNAQPGERLAYAGLEVHRLDDPSQTFDFSRWCGTAPVYTLDVFANAAQPFGPENPYDRDATLSPCP